MRWCFHAGAMVRAGATCRPIVLCRLRQPIGGYGNASLRDESHVSQRPRIMSTASLPWFGRVWSVRSFEISSEIEQDKISAALKDGVMTLVLPKAEKVKPRKISVN